MAAVPHPVPSYRPILPVRVITDGVLSDAQFESVILAGEAHTSRLATAYRIGEDWETIVPVQDGEGNAVPHAESCDAMADYDAGDAVTLSAPVRFRRGWMLGDGTGCGKGRQVAAIIFDNRLKGRMRALWLSQSDKLLEDARRDWAALGGTEDDVIALAKFRQGGEIPNEAGILFATYATLRSPARQGKRSRLDQIISWLAGSRSGARRPMKHAATPITASSSSTRPTPWPTPPVDRAIAGVSPPRPREEPGLRLQNALPDARILYVSATGATTVPGLAYAARLGLWGSGETAVRDAARILSPRWRPEASPRWRLSRAI